MSDVTTETARSLRAAPAQKTRLAAACFETVQQAGEQKTGGEWGYYVIGGYTTRRVAFYTGGRPVWRSKTPYEAVAIERYERAAEVLRRRWQAGPQEVLGVALRFQELGDRPRSQTLRKSFPGVPRKASTRRPRRPAGSTPLMPFGKYRGTELDKVPEDYMDYIVKQEWIQKYPTVAKWWAQSAWKRTLSDIVERRANYLTIFGRCEAGGAFGKAMRANANEQTNKIRAMATSHRKEIAAAALAELL